MLQAKISPVEPDLVFVIGSVEQAVPLAIPQQQRTYSLVFYLKVDDLPMLPRISEKLGCSDRIYTMAKCGHGLLPRPMNHPEPAVIFPPSQVDRFLPVSEFETKEMRSTLFPAWMPQTAFVLGWVGRNLWRKQVWLLYKVIHYLRTGKYLICSRCEKVSLFDWDPLERKHAHEPGSSLQSRSRSRFDRCTHCNSPDVHPAEPLCNVFLWLHMPEDDPQSAWSLRYLEWEFGVQRNEDIFYTEGYSLKAALPPEEMPTLYQLWDCLLYLSGGEGFGLPAWEAMCTGIPVIYTNYSGHSEYLNAANAGIPVEGILQPEPRTNAWRMIADISEAIAAVRKLFHNRHLCRQLGAKGRAFVQEYTPEIQAQRWHEIFRSVLQDRKFEARESICAAAR